MQKRKIHKSNQPMPIDAIQDALDDIFMGQFTPTEESISQMMSSVISNSMELSKLVIDNRVRNSEKLQDEDIYDIYKKSIKVAMQAMEPQGKF
jgi:hypothetical protein